MQILKKEQTFNRWLVWLYYTDDESCLLEIMGQEEPNDSIIEQEYNNWLAKKEENGVTQ